MGTTNQHDAAIGAKYIVRVSSCVEPEALPGGKSERANGPSRRSTGCETAAVCETLPSCCPQTCTLLQCNGVRFPRTPLENLVDPGSFTHEFLPFSDCRRSSLTAQATNVILSQLQRHPGVAHCMSMSAYLNSDLDYM